MSGYSGLPPYYVLSSDPFTPNLGLSLKGMGPEVAENFVLVDAFAGTGVKIKVNGSVITNPNFNSSTPAAPAGYTNVTWQVDGSGNISAYAGSLSWNNLQNATGPLTIFNDGYPSTFNQSGAVAWKWDNVSPATAGVPQSSPVIVLGGQYWNGSSVADSWSLQDVVGSGLNGTSTLTFSHSGSAGAAVVSTPALSIGNPTSPTNPPNVGFLNITGLQSSVGFFQMVAGSMTFEILMQPTPNVVFGTTSNNDLLFETNSAAAIALKSSGSIVLATGSPLSWAATSPLGAALPDTGLSRLSAGELVLGNGSFGDYSGALQLKSVIITDTASNVDLTIANTTGATSGTSQSSPIINLVGRYWNGVAGAVDTWSIQSTIVNGTNGSSNLTFSHSGSPSTGVVIEVPDTSFPNYGLVLQNTVFTSNFQNGLSFYQNNGGVARVFNNNVGSFNIDTSGNLISLNTLTAGNPSSVVAPPTDGFFYTVGQQSSSNPFWQATAGAMTFQMWMQIVPNVLFGTSTNHDILFQTNNVARFALKGGGAMLLATGNVMAWAATSPLGTASADTGLSRLGAASLALGNGSASDFSGSLKLTNLTATGVVTTGGIVRSIVTKTANYGTASTDWMILCNGTFTVTLTNANAAAGQAYRIKNIGTGSITVSPSSGNIDGAASTTLASQYTSIDVTFDGTNWWIG